MQVSVGGYGDIVASLGEITQGDGGDYIEVLRCAVINTLLRCDLVGLCIANFSNVKIVPDSLLR